RVEDFTQGQLANVRVFLNPDYNKQPGTSIDHLLFRDVSYRGHNDSGSQIQGYDSSREVTNVTFENLDYNGQAVLAPADGQFDVGPDAQIVVFRAQPKTTTFDDSSSAIQYSQGWKVARGKDPYGGSVHLTSRTGSRMTFAFNGTEARVYGTTAPGRGMVDVFV